MPTSDCANRECTDRQPRLAVYRVYVPPLRAPLIRTIVIVLGAVVSCSVGSIVGFAVTPVLLGTGRTTVEITVLFAGGLLCLSGWLAAASIAWPHRLRDQPTGRRERLASVLGVPSVATRLPHRGVEWVLRRHPTSSRKLRAALRTLPPGTIIVANGPRRVDGAWRPAGAHTPFEPVGLASNDEQLGWLLYQDALGQGHIEEDDTSSAESGRAEVRRVKGATVFGSILSVVGILWLVYCLFLAVTGQWGGHAYFALLVLGMILLGRLADMFWERAWWVVPAGLLCRESRLWRKAMAIRLFAAEESALFLDMREGHGFVHGHGQVLKFDCPHLQIPVSWGVLSAWLSTARRPTLEEVRSYLGPDAESADAVR